MVLALLAGIAGVLGGYLWGYLACAKKSREIIAGKQQPHNLGSMAMFDETLNN